MPQSNEYMLKQDDAELIYQKKLTAGTNITIDPITNTISATGGGGGGSTVSVIPIVTTGTKIATIVVDAIERDLYAPGTDVRVTPTVSTGVQIATITIDGTDYYLYAPEGSGGNQVYFGTTDPSDAIGNDKDFYYKLTNLRNTYPVYTHLKMVINANRDDDNYTQLSEINIIDTNSNIFDWSGTTVSCSAETGAGDGPENLIDGLTSTKACAETTPTAASPIEFTFTLGTPIDTEDYQSWCWYTADADSERDPISFDFYGSEDGEVWELLTSVTAQEITTTREALAYTEDFALSVGEISILNRYVKIDDTWIVESGGGGNVDDVTINGVSILDEDKIANIPVFDGTTEEDDGVPGLVPSPTAQDTGKVLGSDGTWVDASSIVELKKDDYDDLPSSKESDDILYLLKDISSFSGLYSEKTQQEYDDLPITKNSDDIFYYITDARTIIHNGNIYGGGKTYEAGDNILIEDDVISGDYQPFEGTDGTEDGASGLVPKPLTTDVNKFLKSDGTWAEVQGGGGVGDITNYYGVFVDTNNVILPETRYVNGDSYTATEDCYAIIDYQLGSGKTQITLNGADIVNISGVPSSYSYIVVNLAKGQRLDLISTFSGSFYLTVYGVKSGDRIPALIQNAQIYSEDERVVGVWTDGKPLYQKTISFPANTSQTFSVSLGVQDVEYIFLVPDGCYGNDGTWTIPYVTGNNYLNNIGGFFENLGTGNTAAFAFRVGQESAPYNRGGVLTFRYTKTTDTAGSGGYQAYGMSPVIYSEKEREIGVWINNKPLYQKTLVFENYTNGTYQDISSLNIEEIVNNFGEHRISDYSYGLSFPYYENNNWYSLMTFDKNNGRYYVYCSSSMASTYKWLFITIQYTKTTDSPKRTGYELLDIQENQIIVDATRYSTEEKIIGTWTDGKPLYQKTFDCGALPNAQTKEISYTEDMETATIIDAFAVSTSEGYVISLPDVVPNYVAGSVRIYLNNTAKKICIYSQADMRTYDKSYVTIRYTKTTDAAGSGGYQAYGFSPIIYSTEEREVGVWTDGKPIYKRTWLLSNEVLVNSNGVTISEIDASMIEHLIECNGGFQSLSNTKSIPILVWKYNNTWYYGSSINAYIDTVTLTYTKTTDVAGSGEYNTLGIPNVHYDGNEKVIGTFFGKTLYQKSEHIILSTPISPNTDTTVNFSNFSNITSFLSLEAVGGLYGNSDHVTATYGFWEQSTSGSSSGDRIIKEWDMSHMVVRTGSNYNNFPSAGVDNRIREFWVTMCYTKD